MSQKTYQRINNIYLSIYIDIRLGGRGTTQQIDYYLPQEYDLWDGGEAHNEDHFGCLDVNLQANQIKEKIIWDAYVYAYIRSI